jgi:hypothetical protein
VAVVHVSDRGVDETGRPSSLGFHLLVLPRSLYYHLGGDPFAIAEAFPPSWQARGELPSLSWTAPPPSPRTVEQLRLVLNVDSSPTLLGAVQGLLDGGRVVFERPAPEEQLIRSLWQLLPTQSRCELWPATFAFRSAGQFHAVVVPKADAAELAGYIREDQAGDYPEGYYESHLQSAVKRGDQQELDQLLARRSRAQVMRLAIGLLIATLVVGVVFQLLSPAPQPTTRRGPTSSSTSRQGQPDLPSAQDCPPLSAGERQELARQLQSFAKARGISVPAGSTEADLKAAIEAVDHKLGTPESGRDPGRLSALGPVQRQLRALLWKHGVPEYNVRELNTVELVERLQQHLDRANKQDRDRDGQGK